ncbi:ArsR/SmtB family transcription factor [Nocardiopsis sediminis]|uniref:ArsR/SmtB family transcription factor n=1 Tax=Nocardiopsis sediminis TaxID=1778267 RepID=A0ABV8FLI1_9ACTN
MTGTAPPPPGPAPGGPAGHSATGRPAEPPTDPLAGDDDLVFAALADRTRRDLLDALAARGRATATELAAALPVTRQAVAKHLAVLRRARLISGTRNGREVHYSLRPGRLAATAGRLSRLAAAWEGRLALRRCPEGGAPPR